MSDLSKTSSVTRVLDMKTAGYHAQIFGKGFAAKRIPVFVSIPAAVTGWSHRII